MNIVLWIVAGLVGLVLPGLVDVAPISSSWRRWSSSPGAFRIEPF
jgi:hypothetical protein